MKLWFEIATRGWMLYLSRVCICWRQRTVYKSPNTIFVRFSFIHPCSPLSIYLSIYLSIHPSIHPSIYPSIYLSIYLSISLSARLSVCTYFGLLWLGYFPWIKYGWHCRHFVGEFFVHFQRRGLSLGKNWLVTFWYAYKKCTSCSKCQTVLK